MSGNDALYLMVVTVLNFVATEVHLNLPLQKLMHLWTFLHQNDIIGKKKKDQWIALISIQILVYWGWKKKSKYS